MDENSTHSGPVALVERQTPLAPACTACGRESGVGVACQFCAQLKGVAPGIRLATPGKRLGAHLLDQLLMLVTFFIGWIVWAAITFKDGQTPAKKLLSMRTVNLATGRPASWGGMFVREVLAKLFVSFCTFGIGFLWLLWDHSKQNLYDKMMGTVVVDEVPTV